MAEFVAKFTAGTCPGCRKPVKAGDRVEYLPVGWPREAYTAAAKTVLWHRGCGSKALVDALCSVCHLLHDGKDGSCLL